MKQKYFFNAMLILAIIACQGDNNDSIIGEKITIDPLKKQSIKRSEIFSLNNIIQLEDHPDFNIGGQIRSVVPGKDFILINGRSGNNVSAFAKSGKFLFNVGEMGKGPGEYMSCIKVLSCNSRFRLLDRTQQKFIDYDINGNFIDEHEIGMYGQSFTCWDDYVIVYCGNEPNDFISQLFLYDHNFKLLDDYFDICENRAKYMHAIDKTNFFIYQDSLRFLNSFDYNIYNVDVSHNSFKIEPRYYIDFGKYKIPDYFYERGYNNVAEYLMALDENNYAHRIHGEYIENDDNIFIGFRIKESWYIAIYDKYSKRSIVIDEIVDDLIFSGLRFPPVIIGPPSETGEFLLYYYFDNQVYFLMYAYQFLDKMKQLKENMTVEDWLYYKNNNPEFIKMYNEMDESDNPIIFVFDFKPFRII